VGAPAQGIAGVPSLGWNQYQQFAVHALKLNRCNAGALSIRKRVPRHRRKESAKESAMNAKNVPGPKPKAVPLATRYGKIGIAAVEAAARYQSKGDKAKSIKAGDPKPKSQVFRGTSPKR
jgi:hypothetical protein